MEVTIKICDLCKVEIRSDEYSKGRHWSSCINPIHINLKSHGCIQQEWKLEVCSNCAYEINEVNKKVIEKLTKESHAKIR